MEVKGLMLWQFVDDYTINYVIVFAKLQSGIDISIEVVEPIFQMKILDMLKHTG